MLIIDEPENHFHEDLLVKFIGMLSEITRVENYANYIINNDNTLSADSKKASEVREIKKQYQDYYLSQVFLLTHSKNIIYNNFSNDTNYYVSNALIQIKRSETENTLREIGISSVYSRILFVEGESDNEFLELFFNEHNIKIHPLSGCGQVIDTYRKILPIKMHIRDTFFVFLIDKDTRTTEEILQIRSQDPIYFDSHFCALEKHEFENYLLDPNIFKEIIERHRNSFAGIIDTVSVEDIEKQIFRIANENKPEVIKKALKKLNEQSISKLKEVFIKKEIEISSLSSYMVFLESKFQATNTNTYLKNMFIENFQTCTKDYEESIWRESWQQLCDGKIVLAQTTSYYARHLGIKSNLLKQQIKSIVHEKRNFEVNKLIENLLEMFPKK